MLKQPETVYIKLEGFTAEDVREYLLKTFGKEKQVTEVNPNVVEVLLQKTSQSPLALRLTTEVLAESGGLDVVNEVLNFSENANLKDEWFESVLSSAIVMQFDKLHNGFQAFLQYACIFGQYFNVTDVCELMGADQNADVEYILSLIAMEDTFGFLKKSNDVANDYAYFFRHISIANAIYNGLAFSKRSSFHGKLGSIFEKKLDDTTRAHVLPLLYHHYSLSSHVVKRIFYSDQLSAYYAQLGFFQAAVSVLKSLLDFIESLENIPQEFNQPSILRDWYLRLAQVASADLHIEVALTAAKKVFESFNRHLPSPGEFTNKMLSQAIGRQFRLFLKTKGGRKPVPGYSGGEALTRQRYIDGALVAIHDGFLMATDIAEEYKRFLAIELLNESIVIATLDPPLWAKRCVTFAFALMIPLPWFCKLYFEAGRDAWKKCPSEKVAKTFNLFYIILCYLYKADDAVLTQELDKFEP
ncbi:hypothetical protein HDU96_006730, partial [Phlyctochytrium bullatum]